MGRSSGGRVARCLLAVVVLAGCKMDLRSDSDKRQEVAQLRQEEKERQQDAVAAALKLREQQEAEKKALEKSQLLAQPDSFLETSNSAYFDKGIINDYRQLVGVSVLNKAKYPVTDLQGEVDWFDENGGKFGSVPFTMRGSIAAGATVRFTEQAGTLSNGTIQGKATRARIRFTSLRIAEVR